jgi:cyclopropane-fatty-acyl-phospholipid synthase
MDLTGVGRALFDQPARRFDVELWDGSVSPADAGPSAGRLKLIRPWALTAFLPPWSERRLARAFIDGDLEIEGSMVDVLHAAATWPGPASGLPPVPRWVDRLLGSNASPPRRTVSVDEQNVRRHYDTTPRLFDLFLDSELVYSCAYFRAPSEPLEVAQRNKLELVCKKLELAPGERLLDIGCGWGALLRHAALHHRAAALGITVSPTQLLEARRRAAAVPNGAMIDVRYCDYRAVAALGPFHKVASIGMMEHVGRAGLDRYFHEVYRGLKHEGLFLNHAIATVPGNGRTHGWMTKLGGGFVERSIFPGSELIPFGEVVAAAERAGFEVRDVESLREHYDQTLCAWLERLESRAAEAGEVVGDEMLRTWRLYLACSAAAFRAGSLSVFQLLLQKSERRSTGRRTVHARQALLPAAASA